MNTSGKFKYPSEFLSGCSCRQLDQFGSICQLQHKLLLWRARGSKLVFSLSCQLSLYRPWYVQGIMRSQFPVCSLLHFSKYRKTSISVASCTQGLVALFHAISQLDNTSRKKISLKFNLIIDLMAAQESYCCHCQVV